MLLLIINFVILLNYCNGQAIIFRDPNKYVGDNCVIKNTNTVGVCRPLSDCQSITNTKPKPYCGWNLDIPIVCCPKTSFQAEPYRRISQIKCEEYKSFLKTLKPVSEEDKVFGITVVGGINADKHEFPHMALLGWTNLNNEIEWKCGGFLISENYVLTAGHCSSDRGAAPVFVRVGEHDIKSTFDDGDIEDYMIKRIIKHPDYSTRSFYNDLALIELSQSVILKKHIRPACLWQSFEPDSNTAWATGWGKIEYAGDSASILQKVILTVYSNQVCNKSIPQTRKLEHGIVSTQICYGDSGGDKDTCQGDSGGPIQTRYRYLDEYVYDIIGITSFGSFCGSSAPSVYTRISSYLDWIESVAWTA